MKATTKKNLSFILLFIVTIIWGSAFSFQGMASEYISSYTFNFLRFTIASIVLIPIALYGYYHDKKRGIRLNWKKLIIGSVLSGALVCACSILQQFGIQISTVGKAGFITSQYILIIPILCLFLKRKYSINVYLSCVISLVGVYFLCAKGSFNFELGDIYFFLTAFGFAIQILIIEYFANNVNPLCLSLGQVLVAALISVGPCFIVDQPSFESIKLALPSVLYVAVLSTGVGYTGQIVAQKNINPTIASLIMSLESVFSVLFGALLLQQYLTTNEIIGCSIIFFSLIFSQLPPSWFTLKKKKKQIEEAKKEEENIIINEP